METNKIIKLFKERYPEYLNWSDKQLWKNLKQPDKFKKAFPEYSNWDNNKILKNLAKYDKSILYIDATIKNTSTKKKLNINNSNKEIYENLKKTNPELSNKITLLKEKITPSIPPEINLSKNINKLQQKIINKHDVVYGINAQPKPTLTKQTDLTDIYREFEKNIWPKMTWANKNKKDEYFYAWLKTEADYSNKTIKNIQKNTVLAKKILTDTFNKISKSKNYNLNDILKEIKTKHPEQYQIIANAFKDYYSKKIPNFLKLSEMAGRGMLKGLSFGTINDEAINSVLGNLFGKEHSKLIHNISKNTKGSELTEFLGDFAGSVVSGKAVAGGLSKLTKLNKIKNMVDYAKKMALIRGATAGTMTGARSFSDYLRGKMSLKDVFKNTATSTIGSLVGLIPENYINNKTILGKISNLVGQIGVDATFNIVSNILSGDTENIGSTEWWKQQGFNAIPSAVFAFSDLLHPGQLRTQQNIFKKGLREQIKLLKSKINNTRKFWIKKNKNKSVKTSDISSKKINTISNNIPEKTEINPNKATEEPLKQQVVNKSDIIKQNILPKYIDDTEIINKRFTDIKKELQPILEDQLLGMAGELQEWAKTPEAGTRWADINEFGDRIPGGLKSLKPDFAKNSWGRKYVDRYLKHIDNILAGKEDINNSIVQHLKAAALERAKEGFQNPYVRSDKLSDKTFDLLKEKRDIQNRADTSKIDKKLNELTKKIYDMDKIPPEEWTPEIQKRLDTLIKEGQKLTLEKEKIIKNFKKNSNKLEKFLYNNNIEEKDYKTFFDITNKKIDEMTDDEISDLFEKYDFLPEEDIKDNQILLQNGRNVRNILKRLEKMYKPSGISSKTHNVFNHVAKNEILSKDIQTGNKKKIFVYGDLGNFTTMNAIFGHTGTDSFKEKIYKGFAAIVNKYDPEGKFGQDTNGDEHWVVVNLDESKVKQMIKEMENFANTIAKKKYKLDRESLKKFIKNQHGEYKERLQKIYDSGETTISLEDLPYKGGGTKSFSTKEGFVEYDPKAIRESGEEIESAITRITKEADKNIAEHDKNSIKGGDDNVSRKMETVGSKERRGTGSEGDAGTGQRIPGQEPSKQQKSSIIPSTGEHTSNKSENQIPSRASRKSSLVGKDKLGIISPESQFLFELDKVLTDFKNETKNELKEKLNIENIKKESSKIKTAFGKLFERYYGLNRPLQRVFIKYEEGLEGLNRKIINIVIKHFKDYPKEIRKYASYYLENPKKYPAEKSNNPQAVKEVANMVKKFEKWSLEKLKELNVFDKSFKSYFDSKIKLLTKEKEKLLSDLNNAKSKNDNKLYDKISKSIDEIEAEITKIRNLNYLHHYVKNPKLLKKIYIWLKSGLVRKIRVSPKELKGRKFNTIDDLKDAGFEVETDAAVITARILRLTLESMRNKEMIDSLKANKDFVLPKSEAKNNPETVDWVSLPEVDELKGYVIHPFIANAIKELVWTPKYDTAWKKYISKPLRKLNIALKLARFYKPFIMTYNDLQQAWLATPFKSIFTFPKNFKTSFGDVVNKSDLYEKIEQLGGYNKDYTFYKKLVEETVKDILDKKNKGVTYIALRKLLKNINPVNLIKNIYKKTNDITWTLDEIIRTTVVKEFLSLGMPLPEAVDRMNMFMGHYNYLPKSTKHGLNAWAFVGNYRISMARLYKNILKETFKSTKDFIKSFTTAKFKKAGASFKKSLAANRTILKWLIWKIAVSRYLWGLGFTGALLGYRYMKKDKDNIKYVSLGGPIFDPSKILARKLPTTILYNMAALPGLSTALLYNKGWHGKQIYNPNADATTQKKQVAIYILENFFPWTTEIKNLTDKSKKLIDKILNFVGIAYTYEIKKLTPQQLAQMINEIGMRNDLTRSEKIKEIRKLKSKFHRQQIKFHKKLIGEAK